MRFLGIDPGLAIVGIGIVSAENSQALTAEDWLTITTTTDTALPDRLWEIHRDLTHLIMKKKPDLAIVEKLYFATNVQTAIAVAQARGVILLALAEQKVPILEPTPLQLKLAITGDGKADKLQMQTMLLHTLRLQAIPKPDDAADALALAVYGAIQAPRIHQLELSNEQSL